MTGEAFDNRGKLTLERRLDLVEKDAGNLAHSISTITTQLLNVEKEIEEIGAWKMTQLLSEARRDERDVALMERLGRMEKSIVEGIGSIRGFGWRIFWIVMGTVIPAVVVGVAIIITTRT